MSRDRFTEVTETIFAYANVSNITISPPRMFPIIRIELRISSFRRIEKPLSVNIDTTALKRRGRREKEGEREGERERR